MTSLDVAATVRELRGLEGCVARSVLMPTRDTLILELGCGDQVRYLVAEGGRRVHLSGSVFTTESVRTVRPFKRVLEGSRLASVGQLDLERVVVLGFRRGSRRYELYVELLPRGVLALVDEEGKVLAVNRRLSAKDRTVAVGLRYSPPPPLPGAAGLDHSRLAELASKFGGTIAQFLVRVLGVPPEVVNEVLDERERSVRASEVGELGGIVERVRGFVEEVVERPRPCLVLVSGTPVAFFPFRPSRLPEGAELVEYGSMNELLEDYFRRLDESALREAELSRLRDREAAIEKTLREAEENLGRTSERLAEVEKLLDLIERHYYEVETIWECCRRMVKEGGWERIGECGPVSGSPEEGSVAIQLPEGSVELLLYRDLGQQYAELRRERERLREKLERARETIRDLRSKLEEVVSRRQELETLRVRPRRTAWFSRFLWIETSSGFLAIGGRDASQNELLVRRYLGPRDIFMHADVHGAPVFVVLTNGREVPERDLEEVACLAASYSRAWKAGLSAVDVFWVWGEQVSLSAPPGEYLPRGSFMVYGQRNFIRGVRLVLGLGVVYVGDSYDLVVGPPDLVERRSVASVVLVPGETSVEEAAEEIREHFVRRCPDVRGLTARDVARLLPGRVRVLSKR